jgi:hypothetical protein
MLCWLESASSFWARVVRGTISMLKALTPALRERPDQVAPVERVEEPRVDRAARHAGDRLRVGRLDAREAGGLRAERVPRRLDRRARVRECLIGPAQRLTDARFDNDRRPETRERRDRLGRNRPASLVLVRFVQEDNFHSQPPNPFACMSVCAQLR